MTRGIEPSPIIEAIAFDYQRVAIPVANRVAHPSRLRIGFEGAAVEVDLAIGEIFIKHDNLRRSLDNLHIPLRSAVARAQGQTKDGHVVLTQVLHALLD